MRRRIKIVPSNQLPFLGDYDYSWKKGDIDLSLTYLKEEQDSYTCIVLTLLIEGKKFDNFRIVFMDTEGNPLDDYIVHTISEIYLQITSSFNLDNSSLESFIKCFTNIFHDYIVNICYGRKMLMLDFDNPKVWEDTGITSTGLASIYRPYFLTTDTEF